MTGRAFVGISGWRYAPWRGEFYPRGLVQRDELRFASERLTSIEINGSFYSLQRPSSWEHWRDETPENFVFSVKGGRFISHMLGLRNARQALANFYQSGVLALGPKLGPILWQLPERLQLDLDTLSEFLELLPKTTPDAAALAAEYGTLPAAKAWSGAIVDAPLRYALEVRHDSYADPSVYDLLRRYNIALVVADTAGRWPALRELTADLVYVRLHGADELYTSGYTDVGLESWARDIRSWLGANRDVFVYFDNDVKVHAPFDAMSLIERLRIGG